MKRRADARTLAWGLLGPPPEHVWNDAYRDGDRIPLPWEKSEPTAEAPMPEEPPKKRRAKKK